MVARVRIDRVKLSYKSFEEINALREQIEGDPANQQPGFYRYTPKARKKLDDIAWAVTNKLARQAKEPSVTSHKPRLSGTRVPRITPKRPKLRR